MAEFRVRRAQVRRTSVIAALGLAVSGGAWVLAQGPLTPIGQLRGRTDAAGALYTVAAVATGQPGPLTPIAQLRGRTDSSGSLLTTVAGGTVTPDKICLDNTNQDVCLQRNAAGVLQLGNAATSTDFGRLQFGGATSSFPAWRRNGTSMEAMLADASARTGVLASSFAFNSTFQVASTTLISVTAPTIASGFGTSPSVAANNGTAVFTVNVGTGGTASAGVLTMPAASVGWACDVNMEAVVPTTLTKQTANTTTSVTVTNYTVATGATAAWGASTILTLKCLAR